MAILENWEQVAEAQEVAANSAGTSAQKYDIYLNSIQAHLNTLKTTWSEFLMNLGNSGVINTAIDALSGFVKIIDKLINNTPMMTALITALGVALANLTINKLANIGKAFINMTSGIKSTTGIVNQISMGLQTLLGIAPAAAAGTEAVGVAGFSAAGGMAALGASLSAILPAVLAIAGVAAVVVGVVKGIDKLIVTNKELSESFDEHTDNITKLNSTLDEYSNSLDENKQKIEELQSLKSAGNITKSQEQELSNLEQQNKLLEEQIQLTQARINLETKQQSQDATKLFKNKWNLEGQTWWSGFTNMLSNNSTYGENVSGVDLVKKQVASYNGLVGAYKMVKQEYTNLVNSGTKDTKKLQRTEEKLNAVQEKMQNKQDELLESRSDLLDQSQYLSDADKELADSMLSVYDNMQLADSAYSTLGEQNKSTAAAMGDTAAAADLLYAKIKNIHGSEIKPKDADDMKDWLESLSGTEIDMLDKALDGMGNSADALLQQLSGMNKAEGIKFLTEAYKNFNGTLDDATAKLKTFESAQSSNNFDMVSKVAGAANFISRYQKGEETNFQTYKAALDIFGLSTQDNIEKVNEKLAVTRKYIGADGTQSGAGTMYDNIIKLSKASKESGDNIDSMGRTLVEVSKDAQGNDVFKISSVQDLADKLKLSQTEAQAYLKTLKEFGDVEIGASTTKLEENLQQTANDISNLLATYQNAHVNIDVSTTEGKQKINDFVTQLNSTIQERYGITLDVHSIGLEESEAQFRNLDELAQSAASHYKELFSGTNGSLNLDSVKTAIEEANKTLDKEHQLKFNIDTQSITNMSKDAVSALNSALGGDTGLTSIVLKSLSGGIKDNLGNMIDFSALSSQLTAEGNAAGAAVASAINENLKGITAPEEQAWAEAFKAAAVTTGTTMTTTLTNAINAACAVDGQSAALNSIGSQIGNLKIGIADVGSSIAGLVDKASSVAQQVTQKMQAAQSLMNATSAKAGNEGATGLTPIAGYATGKDGEAPTSDGREHLTTLTGKNALVGEIGEEYVVRPDGSYKLVGQDGAELIHLDAGDTVLPHNVTELLKRGKIGGYSTAASASIYNKPKNTTITPTVSLSGTSSSTSSKSSSKSSSSSGSSSKSSSGSSSKSGSSSSSSSSSTNEQAENELKALEHQRKMEYITEKQYAEKYRKIWEKYYKNVAEYRDKDWEMQEKLHDLEKTFFEDRKSQIEEEIDMLERSAGTEQQQIAKYKQLQELYHQRAEMYRRQGFSDDSPEIRELSKEWWTLQDQIQEAEQNMFDNFINDWQHASDIIDAKIELIPEVIVQASETSAESMESLQSRLTARFDQFATLYKQKIASLNVQLAETQNRLNQLYKQGYEKNKEQIQKLEEQLLTYKKNILETANALKEEEIAGYEKQLDYQDQLKEAIKDYAQSRADAIQDEIDKLEEENEALDKQAEKQKLLDALNSAKNRNKRVYHADTGETPK